MTGDRILRLMLAFLVAGVALVLGLVHLMGGQHEQWLERSYRNRWAFRDVPSRRGTILDRHGVPIAWDEPGVDLELRYRGFRRFHPVGIAIHGANLLERSLGRARRFRLDDEDRRERFDEALRLLLRTPVGLLGPYARDLLTAATPDSSAGERLAESFSKIDARDLRFYTSSLMSRLSGVSSSRFHLALREAAADYEQRDRTVLELGRTVCAAIRARPGTVAARLDLDTFDRSVVELETLDRRLGRGVELFQILGERQDAWRLWRMFELLPEATRRAMRDGGFWVFLDDVHDLVFEDWRDLVARVPARGRADCDALVEEYWELDDDERDGFAVAAASLGDAAPAPPLPWNEDVPRSIARRVPYEDAVWLRIVRDRHPGFSLMPSVRRAVGSLPGRADSSGGGGRALGTLSLLLGTVTPAWKEDATAQLAESARRLGAVGVGEFLEDWPEDLPPSLADAVAQSASRAVQRHILTVGRFGRGGIEGALDDRLRGTPGMRFVERDRRREQRLFSSLDVNAGEDLRLTIDLRLQALLEQVLLEADEGFERGATILDARSGDILAIAGQPLESGDGERAKLHASPALMARRNAAIGSVIKPFVALEQLEASLHGRPCAQPEDFRACDGRFNRNLSCSHSHGDQGRNPVHAIGQSCNFYFYSAVRGLGDDGFVRAMRRVGWLDETADEAPPPPAYVDRIVGLSGGGVSAPHRPRSASRRARIELQGIGYGIHVNTLFVARAYGALATGYLAAPRLILDEAPPSRVPLDVAPDHLEIVRDGLRECVVSGTARGVKFRPLEVSGKTGTAEVGATKPRDNNSWFAGYLPPGSEAQLAFAVAFYQVPPGQGGGAVAAPVIARLLELVRADPVLAAAYLPR